MNDSLVNVDNVGFVPDGEQVRKEEPKEEGHIKKGLGASTEGGACGEDSNDLISGSPDQSMSLSPAQSQSHSQSQNRGPVSSGASRDTEGTISSS